MQSASNILIGSAFGLVSSILFAIQNVIFKSQKDSISPVYQNTIKLCVGLGVMFFVVFLPFRIAVFSVPADRILPLALSVFLGAAFGDLVYFSSQNRVGVSVAFPIAHSYPIITYFIAILFLGESFLWSRFTGVVLTVFGILFISKRERATEDGLSVQTNSHSDQIGIILAVISAVMFALATVLIQVGVADVDPLDGNLVRLFFGSLVMLPVLGFVKSRGDPVPPRRVSLIVVLIGIFGFTTGSLFFVASIKYAGATVSGVVTATAPLFAIPLTIRTLKEKVGWSIALGTVLTVIGVALTIIGV